MPSLYTDAKREASELPDKLHAQALGVTVEEAKSNRVLIQNCRRNLLAAEGHEGSEDCAPVQKHAGTIHRGLER
jgi:hypothetical protein